MSREHDLCTIQFNQLCSGSGSWSMRLLNHATHNLIDHQTCLPSEMSKLLSKSGSNMVDCVQHQDQLYSLEEVQMQPVCQQLNVLVWPRAPRVTAKVVLTPAQKILAAQLPAQLQTPAAQVHAFIRLNDQLFTADPASLVFVVGESQYNEYDYLAALTLHGLRKGLHPEYVVRTLFDKAGLDGRYNNDALDSLLNAMERVLREVLEPSPLTDTLLLQKPDVFTCSALLQPVFAHAALPFFGGSADFWSESLDLSQRILAGEGLEVAMGTVFDGAVDAFRELDKDDLIHLQDEIRKAAACASILYKSRIFKAVLNPRPNAESRFDTGLSDLLF